MTRPMLLGGLKIAARCAINFGAEPTIDVDPDGYITLNWDTPSTHMEVRVRHDGKVNWYQLGLGGQSGNEGWSTYDPFAFPWNAQTYPRRTP